MFRVVLSFIFATVCAGPVAPTAHAEEAISAESVAEGSVSTAEGTTQVIAEDPFLFAYLGGEAMAYLLTTAGVLLTVGGTIMYINHKTELKRRYRDAAAEAAHLKMDFPHAPLAHAEPGGSLAKMIELETATAKKANFKIEALNQSQLVDLVIYRSKLLEAK